MTKLRGRRVKSARERKAQARARAHDRAVLKRKLRIGSLAILVAALGGGVVFDSTYFASAAGDSVDVIGDLVAQEFETIPPRTEEQLRARWEQLDHLQWELHRNIATELDVSPIIPAPAIGSSAADMVAKEIPEIVPLARQLELREETDPEFKAAREASEAEIANSRNATFLADSAFEF